MLVHDGKVLTESTVINEYIDTVFPDRPLRPADPYERARMRIWTKFVDEYFCPALSFIGWHNMIRNATRDIPEEEFEKLIARIPLKEQQDKWRESARQEWTEEQLEEWRRRVRVSVARMEGQLAGSGGPWILGKAFTLADVSCFAMAVRMPDRPDGFMNDKVSPRCMDWYRAITARPAVIETLAMRRSSAANGMLPSSSAA